MPQQNVFIPIAIIIAGFIIAIALVFTKSDTPKQAAIVEPEEKIEIELTKDEHIKGDPNAKITIVEFSDLECPFCKRFHPTMQEIVKNYDVRWVYKHFPLDSLHPKARKEAEATECAAEQGKFWEYTDRLFEITPSNNGLDLDLLPKIAQEIGLDKDKFISCLDSGRYQDKVQEHYNQAIKAGGNGTPHNVIIAPDGSTQAVPGAVGYSTIAGIIEQLLE